VKLLPVADVPDGKICRIDGIVGEYASTLRAPLSGRACVYYMVLVEESGRTWTEREGVAFGLEDASGRAVIDPSSARVALLLDHREDLKALRDATPQQDAVLLRHGYDVRGAGDLIFYEAVIAVGERITVVGAGSRELDGASDRESGFRDPPATRLRVKGSDTEPLCIASSDTGPLCIASNRAC
jgi:hypothetical protein